MLQVLCSLEASLAYSRAAVLAAHPALVGEDASRHGPPVKLDAASWIADEILTHLAGLKEALGRYAVEVDRARTRSLLGVVEGEGRPGPGRSPGRAA
jgi:hypothetical protein